MNGQTTPMTAVVADNEPEIRALIAEYLAARGYQVTEAEDGLRTLLHVKNLRPALLILDLMMPRLGGIDALIRIRKNFPNVVVIVLTGTTDDALRGRVASMGAAAVLPKPVDLDILGMMIGTVTPQRSQTKPESTNAASTTPELAPVRVLVVDDDEIIRDLLREFIESRGYRPLLASDGTSALHTVLDTKPDVVLLDIEMPRLGGIEALTAIRAIAPDTRVIMISGIESEDTARRALSHGAFDYVRKPIDFSYLERSLELAGKLNP
jgi:DNA-binding response OmpR family regulator